jgi:hypothetical protein
LPGKNEGFRYSLSLHANRAFRFLKVQELHEAHFVAPQVTTAAANEQPNSGQRIARRSTAV